MAKKLQIKLLPNGEIHMETQGIKGKKCLDYIDIVKEMVQGKIIDKKITKEYYETETEITTDENQELRIDNF